MIIRSSSFATATRTYRPEKPPRLFSLLPGRRSESATYQSLSLVPATLLVFAPHASRSSSVQIHIDRLVRVRVLVRRVVYLHAAVVPSRIPPHKHPIARIPPTFGHLLRLPQRAVNRRTGGSPCRQARLRGTTTEDGRASSTRLPVPRLLPSHFQAQGPKSQIHLFRDQWAQEGLRHLRHEPGVHRLVRVVVVALISGPFPQFP